MGSGWGSSLTIRQESNSFAIEYAHFSTYDMQPPLRLVYALDGSDSVNSVMIGHAESTQHSRAVWREQTLLITTQIEVPGSNMRVEVQQALTLESPQTLVIETTRSGNFRTRTVRHSNALRSSLSRFTPSSSRRVACRAGA